jgi:OmpA-OmpF porin, OOP family
MTCDVRLRLGLTSLVFAAFVASASSADRAAAQSVSATVTTAPAPVSTPAQPPVAAAAPPVAATPATAEVTTTTVTTSAQPVAAEPDKPIGWDLLHRRFNTWNGPTGGLYLLDGRTGEPGAVRVQLGLSGFTGSSYLQRGDHIQLSEQLLSFSGTVTENLELFATLSNRTTNQTKPTEYTLDAIGDVSLGAKLGTHVGKALNLGADLRATFLNKVGGAGFEWGATSLWLRSALAVDLTGLDKPVPFIARFNVGYLLDNSSVLVHDTENARYALTDGSTPKADETTHLISRFERLAMGVNRTDRFTFGAGVELPLELAERFYLHPMVEWQLGLPVNRQNYDCPFVASNPRAGNRSLPIDDSCYERSPSVLPMNLSIAVRVVPPVRGLSALLGVDIGLSGTSKFVRDLSPNVPWRFMFALSFDYDAHPAPPPVVVVQQPVAAVVAAVPEPVTARVQGIVATPEGLPIPDTQVRFPDHQLTALATGSDGRFTSEPLPAGPVAIDVTHPDYEPSHCSAVLAQGAVEAEVRCTMTAKPLFGKLQGQVLDAFGGTLSGARVIITGPTNALVISDEHGGFVADKLSPGPYKLRIEAGGYFTRQSSADVDPRSTTLLSPNLARKPIAPTVLLHGDKLDAPNIVFKTDTSTDLSAAALESIAEIAEMMLVRPDLHLQVQGYGTDAVASARALLIKQRLVDAGIAEDHIEAVGGGKRSVRLTMHQ